MGAILSILFLSFIMQFIPFFAVGWLLKGWRPFLASFVGTSIFIFVIKAIPAGIVSFAIAYFVGVAMYALGGRVRTGKSTDEILSGKPVEENV